MRNQPLEERAVLNEWGEEKKQRCKDDYQLGNQMLHEL